MKNLDTLMLQKSAILTKLNQAVKDGDEAAFAAAFTEFSDFLQEAVLAEARGMVETVDRQVLAGRGARALTSKEKDFYQKFIDAAKSKNPQQALTGIDDVLPETVIDAVFLDIQESHPLLSEINFVNTAALVKYIYSTLDGRLMATWGKLCDEVVKDVSSGFDTIDLTLKKLSAFIPVCKAMLEVGPEWLDRYVRALLVEASANGLEEGIIDGNGLDEPIGMRRNPAGAVDPVTGNEELVPVALTTITPATYGALIAALAVGRNGLYRAIPEVLFICNPVDYYTKVMPAVMYQNAEGQWVSRWPFPTKVVQSVHVPANEAILGIGKNYFMGLGTGQGGKIEYSDHYHFVEDERIYLIKLYGNGRPKDNTSFKLLNITGLVPVIPQVTMTNTGFDVDATILDQPILVNTNDARLVSLTVGSKTLSPTFNKSIFAYTCATTDATNTITAVAKDGEATIAILNGATPVVNGAAATWGEGDNVLTVTVSIGGETETYTVTVAKS